MLVASGGQNPNRWHLFLIEWEISTIKYNSKQAPQAIFFKIYDFYRKIKLKLEHLIDLDLGCVKLACQFHLLLSITTCVYVRVIHQALV